MGDAWSALQARKRANPGAPLVTYVDTARGERVELSSTSVENAAAKIANALRDEFDCEAGARVSISLPMHWQRTAWCAGIWTAGCLLALDDLGTTDLTVLDEHSALTSSSTAGEVVAVSLHPFGLPISAVLPSGIQDATVSVRNQPDAYLFEPPLPSYPALVWNAEERSQEQVLDQAAALAARWGLSAGGRLLVAGGIDLVDAWLACLAVPLVTGGSVVLATGDVDADVIVAAERITAVASP
ncbi:MAG: TIGR03089 family protein [Actinomycetes bacterium]